MLLLDNNLEIPLYIQLYRQFRDQILNGELDANSKLPSNRKLCNDLNISRNTVDMAYQQLYSEGFIYSKPRMGYYVEKLDYTSYKSKVHTEQQAFPSFITDNSLIKYDFRYGKLNENDLPVSQWHKLSNKCFKEAQSELSSYGPTFGEYGLRDEILKYLQYYRGIECSSSQIIIGAGVHYCLGMLCQLLGNSTPVAMEDPGYHVTRFTFENHGFTVNPITLDSQGLNVKELSLTNSKAVYVTPSHQYPLGIIMPISRRLQIIDWATKNDSIIIEDDYSCHLRYNTKPVQSLQSLCGDKVVYIGSFSKFLFPSIRLAFMILPENLMDKFSALFNGYPPSVAWPIQKTLELFMKEGHWESYLRKNNKQQKKKHDKLVDLLNKNFGDRISIYGMNAGLHLLVQAKWDTTEEELIDKANQSGVKVYPTSRFWKNQHNKLTSTVLLGFSGLNFEDIEPAVNLLHDAWTK